jgi:hypothetical protein
MPSPEKIAEATRLHKGAMNASDTALFLRNRGEENLAFRALQRAHRLEQMAAEVFAEGLNYQPTRAVLYRSAAALALQARAFSSAEALCIEGRRGAIPNEIAEEIEEIEKELAERRAEVDSLLTAAKPREAVRQAFLTGGLQFGESVLNSALAKQSLDDAAKLYSAVAMDLLGESEEEAGRELQLAIGEIDPDSFVNTLNQLSLALPRTSAEWDERLCYSTGLDLDIDLTSAGPAEPADSRQKKA